ncbi:hypothetical protein H8A97_24675 [Bradyrhizobium sp. Arg62]|uniref:hypothetical protein n=1 Tax=Bradyrhizobium brasilense TaxID=1419277 RepID=UPI001E440CA1|nr:hypothetical protein [Bradyrhizobium brasilense]MCC8948216.1 hypothetical protein [Bradyrhizobium brasilense]
MARQYILEYNRARGDSIRTAARWLERAGLDVEIIPHKTSLTAVKPTIMSWTAFENAVRSSIDPIRGSVLVMSQSSGRAWICSNRGNQPGVFQEIENRGEAA